MPDQYEYDAPPLRGWKKRYVETGTEGYAEVVALKSWNWEPVGSHTTVTPTASTTLTAPDGAEALLICVEDNNIRYTLDGTTPTAGGTGILLETGTVILEFGGTSVIKIIQEAVAAAVNYQWLKRVYPGWEV